jgi:hypothetical protein
MALSRESSPFAKPRPPSFQSRKSALLRCNLIFPFASRFARG